MQNVIFVSYLAARFTQMRVYIFVGVLFSAHYILMKILPQFAKWIRLKDKAEN